MLRMNELKRLRLAARLTQTELARRADVPRSIVVMLEGGYQKAQQKTLDALEDALRLALEGMVDVPSGALASLKDTGASERGRKGGQASAIKERLLIAVNQQETRSETAAVRAAALSVS